MAGSQPWAVNSTGTGTRDRCGTLSSSRWVRASSSSRIAAPLLPAPGAQVRLGDPGLAGQRCERRTFLRCADRGGHRPGHRQITERPADRDRIGQQPPLMGYRPPLHIYCVGQPRGQSVHGAGCGATTQPHPQRDGTDEHANQGQHESREQQRNTALGRRKLVSPSHRRHGAAHQDEAHDDAQPAPRPPAHDPEV